MVINNRILKTLSCNLVFIVLVFVAGIANAADITVTTDHQPASLNESFQIIFEANGSVDGDPDFSPLSKNFEVLATSQSSNISIVNGDFSSTKIWTLNVLARQAGELTIPSISFGKDRSPQASIEVINGYVPGNNQGQNQGRSQGQSQGRVGDNDVYMEVSASPLDPYVQAQVSYKVKLYRAVPTSNASLSEPEVSGGNAIIERVGEDKNYARVIGGKRYRITERNYVIYPQASGTMTIAPLRFEGTLSRSAFSLFDPFGPKPKVIVRQSAPIKLDVMAMPDNYVGNHWLPAKSVNLTEQWSEEPPVFKVGEPITRTLSITADGVTASQLPEIQHWENTSFKQYPDQPVLNDNEYGGGIVGGRQEKMAIIPSQPGDYILPGITIPWWNTTTDKLEYAKLPERKIHVLPAAGKTSQGISDIKPVPLPNINPSQVVKQGSDEGKEEQAAGTDIPIPESSGIWKWVSFAMGIIWLLTVLGWWLTRHRRKAKDGNSEANMRMKNVLKDLKQACGTNNPQRAKELLLVWGKLNWSGDSPMSLGEIGKRCSAPLQREIERLNNTLYGKGKDLWEGSVFWQVFANEQSNHKTINDVPKGKLEPLFRI